MNSPLTGLGESLSGEFSKQIARWSAIGSGLPVDALNSSLDLAEDIQRMEEDWSSLVALNHALETGFVPEDLFGVLEGAFAPAEQQPSALRPVQPGNYPFTGTPWQEGTSDSPSGTPPESEPWPTDDWAKSQVLNSNADQTDSKHQAPSSTVRGHQSSVFPGAQVQPGFEISSPDFTETMGSGLQMPDAVWNSMVLNPGDPTTQVPSPTEPVNADSFWNRPLQSLGDFATRITYPATEQSENIKISNLGRAATPGANLLTDDLTWMTHNNPVNSATIQQPAAREQPIFTAPLIPGQPDSLSLTPSITDSQPENQALHSITPQHTPSPDPNELLEALTELIIKDFRRYYP